MICVICGKKAAFRYSPDLDIQGVGACKKHNEDVRLAYVMLITSGEKDFYKFINDAKKNTKKGLNENTK